MNCLLTYFYDVNLNFMGTQYHCTKVLPTPYSGKLAITYQCNIYGNNIYRLLSHRRILYQRS